MKKIIVFLSVIGICCVNCFGSHVTSSDSIPIGIQFETGLSWKSVLAKAQNEHKFIFVDFYTTWCGPCKKMEKEVYPRSEVGNFYNDKFICVKMQMDTSKSDNETIKATYADARFVGTKYKVDRYPTFLFFNSEGDVLNRSAGVLEADDFIKLAVNSIDPKKNYYSLLNEFTQGKRDAAEMRYLAHTGLVLGDTINASKVAEIYISYLKEKDLLSKENILFMENYIGKPVVFTFFYKYANSIDKIMKNDDYAQGIIHSIIYQKNVKPVFLKAQKSEAQPNWNLLSAAIQKKYNAYYSDRVVLAAKSKWFDITNNTSEYTKYFTMFVEKYVMSSKENNYGFSLVLNNDAWEIFQDSKDSMELIKALSWSGRAVLMYPTANWMDTYANLMYKLGRKEEAIRWETNAAKIAPEDKDIDAVLEKMKKGEPTW